jgi:hypothetical protein
MPELKCEFGGQCDGEVKNRDPYNEENLEIFNKKKEWWAKVQQHIDNVINIFKNREDESSKSIIESCNKLKSFEYPLTAFIDRQLCLCDKHYEKHNALLKDLLLHKVEDEEELNKMLDNM